MSLLARGHERWAHGTAQFLAARANTTAHFNRAAHPAVFRIVKPRLRICRSIARTKAQVRSERRRIHDLAGVQKSQRVEGLFDFAECLIQLRPKHLAQKRAPNKAVAMFSR